MFLTFLYLPQEPLFGQDGTQKWRFQTGGAIQGSPAIGPEGVIYVASTDRNVYAVNPDGTEKWRFTAAGAFFGPPVISDDGTIHAAERQGNLYALNPDGSLKWTFTGGTGGTPSEMAIADNGTVYFARASDYFAVNPDGSLFWTISRPNESLVTGITIGQDGVVLATTQGRVIALDPLTGAEKWVSLTAFGGSDIGPALADEGTIYLGQRATGENFFAVNPDGSLKWKASLDAAIDAGPSTAVNGDLYVPINFKVQQGMNKGLLLALNPADGSEEWRYETDGGVGTVPAVGFDGTIYFATTANKLIALRPDGTELWVFDDQAVASGPLSFHSSPTIAPDGTLYYGSSWDNHLYAIRGSSPGPAASSWPMARRDVSNTGRFGSDVSRRRWFAPHFFWLDDENKSIVTISHNAGPGATTASFRIDVLNRDGTVLFSSEDSVGVGETKDIVLTAPGNAVYVGAVVIDSSIKDGSFLDPFLTWQLDVKGMPKPLQIGAFFSDPTDAAQVHRFPAEASDRNGLGIAVQNIGVNEIQCSLEFFNADGTMQAEEILDLAPLGSVVDFFNSSLPDGFKGRAAFTCDAPVVVVAVNQDFSNGNFPTDRVTSKGSN